jgi:hypothetical protein
MLSQADKIFGGCMATIIEFYIPQSFHKASKWFPPSQAGKILAFPQADTKIVVIGQGNPEGGVISRWLKTR